LDGDWTSAYPNGTTKLTGKYENGFQVGEWIEYFENGKPKDLITYKLYKQRSQIDYGIMKNRERIESKKDGQAISYSAKDFGKTEEGAYKEGLKDGVWTAYFPGGRIPAVVSSYKKGELDGTMKQYNRKGSLLQEMDFKEGLKHGRFIIYNERGKVLVEKTFEMGVEVIKGQGNKPGSFSPR
jgi:antitoxin component YwqK of YwqJK toxin-antitoxin module